MLGIKSMLTLQAYNSLNMEKNQVIGLFPDVHLARLNGSILQARDYLVSGLWFQIIPIHHHTDSILLTSGSFAQLSTKYLVMNHLSLKQATMI